MNKAICYIRVSTEEQVQEGVSLEAQEDRLRAYCRLQNLDPVVVVDRGISAGKPLAKRPGGVRVLELVKSGVGNVVAWKMDRIFRDALDALAWSRAWDKTGVTLHLVDVGGAMVNSQGAMGRFFLHMLAGFAELERGLISERTQAALAYKKANRKAYSPTPMGFRREGDDLVEDEKELATVERIKVLRRKGWSLRKICGVLNDQGIPAKKGGKWGPGTIQKILKNNLHAA